MQITLPTAAQEIGPVIYIDKKPHMVTEQTNWFTFTIVRISRWQAIKFEVRSWFRRIVARFQWWLKP